MILKIVNTEEDARELRRVMNGYERMLNGEISSAEWERTSEYPRMQWLYFDKTESLPFVVVDNREGECFVEDFDTLDGALQYVLDIHLTSEDQHLWDRHDVIRGLGGFVLPAEDNLKNG